MAIAMLTAKKLNMQHTVLGAAKQALGITCTSIRAYHMRTMQSRTRTRLITHSTVTYRQTALTVPVDIVEC